jgi:hypothetical protein
VRLLIQLTNRLDDGTPLHMRASVPLTDGGQIPLQRWFMPRAIRRQLQRRLDQGKSRGRVRMRQGGELLWKVKPT